MKRSRIALLGLAVLGLLAGIQTTSVAPVSAASVWTARMTDATRAWYSISNSDDGTKLMATIINGPLMRSTDSGATWASVSALGNKNWSKVAAQPNGQRVVAAVQRGPVYMSNDYGVTFTEVVALGSRWWGQVQISSDGTRIAIAANPDVPNGHPNTGRVYVSSDSGATWTYSEMGTTASALSMSRDGRYLVMGAWNGSMYSSSDYGATWTQREASTLRYYTEMSSSDDGQIVYAATLYTKVMKSSDYGVTWTQLTNAENKIYRSIRSSVNGQKIIAVAQTGGTYTSQDAGATWLASNTDTNRNWYGSGISADGSQVFGAVNAGYIYTGTFPTIYPISRPNVSASTTSGTQTSIDVSWNAIANANTYTLKVYDSSGSTVVKTITGISGSATSRTVTEVDYPGMAAGTTYKVTVTAIGDLSNYLSSPESTQVSVATAPAPTTTTTSTTTTTLTPATTLAPVTTTTVAQGQKDVATISGSTTTIPVVTTTTSAPTTTLAPLIQNSSAAAAKAPDAASAKPGEATALVDGEEIAATLSRVNNGLVASVAQITATVSGVSPEGTRIDLDVEGNLRLNTDDFIQVEGEGYSAGESVDVWMYSTPTRIGTVKADESGRIAGRFVLPEDLGAGNHRVVLNGVNKGGVPVILGIGVKYGEASSTSTTTRVLIALPISLAIIAGFVLPNQLRRRRRKTA